MPSKFTENLGLSLWDASDRVHHEDFNADNTKIDAALAGKLGRMEVIKEKHSNGGTFGAYSSFLWVDYNDWEYVAILVDFRTRKKIRLAASAMKLGAHLEIATLPYGSALIVLLPRHDSTRQTQGFIIGEKLTCFKLSITFQEVDGYDIRPEGIVNSPNITIFGGR